MNHPLYAIPVGPSLHPHRPGKVRTRFTCPRCGLLAWAKASAQLLCGACKLPMRGRVAIGTSTPEPPVPVPVPDFPQRCPVCGNTTSVRSGIHGSQAVCRGPRCGWKSELVK